MRAVVATNERSCRGRIQTVSGLEFAASLVDSLAWPAAVVVIVLLFRGRLTNLLSGPVRRLKAGPAGVEIEYWEQTLAAAQQEIQGSPELTAAPTTGAGGELVDELERLIDVSPEAAVMEGFARVERELRMVVGDQADTRSRGARALARAARQSGRISEETASAIDGLSVLRDLAAHGQAGSVGSDRARDYLALADAVLYALRRDAGTGPGLGRPSS